MFNDKTSNGDIPKDLKRITWLANEYGFTYDEIYKASVIKKQIPVYTKGALKISLNDFSKWVTSGFKPANT